MIHFVYHGIQKAMLTVMQYDVRFKLNDTMKITCLLNIDQNTLYLFFFY